jgi:hypothetical protein
MFRIEINKVENVRSGMAGLWSHRMVMKLLGQITSLLIYASMAIITNPELLKSSRRVSTRIS